MKLGFFVQLKQQSVILLNNGYFSNNSGMTNYK